MPTTHLNTTLLPSHKYTKAIRKLLKHLDFVLDGKKPSGLDRCTIRRFRPSLPAPGLLRWPPAVWQWLVEEHVAGYRTVCCSCLLLMLFDILAGVLSARLPRRCGCSDILKGSSVRAAVSAPLLLVSLPIARHLARSIPRSSLFNREDQNKRGRSVFLLIYGNF